MSKLTTFLVAGAVALAAGEVMVWRTAPSFPTLQKADTTAVLTALGDNIFHGKAANGLCFTCHNANARGIKGMGPDLTDATWLHGDGSLEAIKATIEKGVPKPKESPIPMLPGGGSKLSPTQLLAVATYVKSLGPK